MEKSIIVIKGEQIFEAHISGSPQFFGNGSTYDAAVASLIDNNSAEFGCGPNSKSCLTEQETKKGYKVFLSDKTNIYGTGETRDKAVTNFVE